MDRGELAGAQALGAQLQAALVEDVHEARVVDRAVVALEVVLDGDLPVGADLVVDALVEAQPVDVQPMLEDDLGEVIQRFAQRLGVSTRVGEHERTPGPDRHRRQPMTANVKRWIRSPRGAARSAPSRP